MCCAPFDWQGKEARPHSSGFAGIQDKVRALGVGADDYVTKPFHKDELIARIHAIVRRSVGHAEPGVKCGDLTVKPEAKQAEIAGKMVPLTTKEYGMLELLAMRQGHTITKEMFLNQLYGGMDEPEQKIIDVFICKLRKKLAEASGGKNYIETVWGRGTRSESRISRGSRDKLPPATPELRTSRAALKPRLRRVPA